MSVIKMTDLDLKGKTVLVRQDLNVPIKAGKVTSDARVLASIPTVEAAFAQGAKTVLLMSHLGRPTEGEFSDEFSLAPVAAHMGEKMNREIRVVVDYLNGVEATEGEVILLENVRFNLGEGENTDDLAKKYAALCDVFVMDAFGTAHRAQASTHGVAKFADTACAGPLLAAELEALGQALDNPARPMVAIVGGSKVSTKLTVLESLSEKVDQLVVGGGIANTFIAAAGHPVGKSLYEEDLTPTCKKLNEIMEGRGAAIPLASDVVCGKEFSESAVAETKSVANTADDDMIFDIGSDSSTELVKIIKNAGTVVWNGPMGVFEFDQFGEGTKAVSMAIAESAAFSIAGGGDTLAAVDKYDIADKVSYISTGGGAFLEFLEGKKLPAVAILEERANG